MIGSLKARIEDKKRDEHLDMTEEKKVGKKCDRKTKKHKHKSTSGELGATNGLSEGYASRRANEEISSTSYSVQPDGLSNQHCPVSHPASAVTAPSLLHLLHFTPEELAASPGIEAETFPEMDFTESLPESHCSHKSSPRRAEIKLGASPQPTPRLSKEVPSDHYRRGSKSPGEGSGKSHHKQPVPSPRKPMNRSPDATYSRTRSVSGVGADSFKCKQKNKGGDRKLKTPRGRSHAAAVDESRKASLSYHTPDFSKVEPKVHFPKGSYKPPKSRHSVTRDSLSPEPPLVFKSPADIVKEVLLYTDGSPASSDCDGSPTAGATNSTVPLDFRSKRNATTLLEQLQEAYNSLLTKYAEAENTIDRLRLEAKVNLYSDPPKPGHSVQAGLNHDASKLIKLDFPQAQRAEISSSLHPNGHNSHQGSSAACRSPRSPVPQLGQQLASILFIQTDKFLQQLQTFEHLLKSEKLKPFEQIEGLAQLSEGLDSLERGYLLARDEHKVLQQRGVEISPFDPERELEGLIFQCGLRMDELKEQVEQMRRQQPTCEAPATPPPRPTASSTCSTAGEILVHPQSPPEPSPVDPSDAARVEVSSASNESDEDEAELDDEETLDSLYLKPPNGKLRCVEQDFPVTVDHYQSFKELPKRLDHNLRERVPPSAALKTDMQPEDKRDERLGQETENSDIWKTLPLSKSNSDHPDSPAGTSKQWSSRSSPLSCRASSQSSRRRLELKKSHSSSLSSLGDVPAAERRSSKGLTGNRRALSQDGIISPETDSGFVGSDSSRLTPAAAASPLQQRASESGASVPQDGNSGRPQTGPGSTTPPSTSHRRTAAEPRVDSQDQQGTGPGQRRRTFSCSPQNWISQRERMPVDSVLESDGTHTGSEDTDGYYRSIDSLHSSSSSPAARYHHGNSQAANCDDAIQTLEAEITKLKERLESCLRNKKPLSSVKAAPESPAPQARSVEQQREASGGRRETQTVDEVEDESVLRRTTRSTSAQRLEPQHDILRRSELDSSPPQPQVSRCTQTSAAADDRHRRTTSVHSRRTQTRQHPVAADEPDSRRSRAAVCPQCLSGRRGRTERPAGGIRESTPSSSRCHHCPLCGRLEPNRCSEPDRRRHSESPDRTTSRRYFTASPALLEYRPVCPPQVLLIPSPLYVSPNTSTGSAVGGRRRRSLSADRQLSVDGSLNRAIRAARTMKHTSRNMARSLASGLQYQELLTQSCSY
ncbi:AT-hook-containing transcription factor [Stegastes partitus]|uniref:AT-hook-containing transcription factor n=1 Tax=Stegastes partitus TaxID=144197 RepID=A0A9Y4NVP7_9TELE|nr:PREDICTED: AT-hook-containing transcription factor [Stegastes partitus]